MRVAELGQLANVVSISKVLPSTETLRTVDIPITAGTAQSLDLLRAPCRRPSGDRGFLQLRRPTLDEVFLTLTGALAAADTEASR
ncbi:MAG: hypothetical protein R2705_18390 [Ilumatobacteraceae bacterium]